MAARVFFILGFILLHQNYSFHSFVFVSTFNINVFSVLYSAIGQFKKQFDYLEENPGKSGPVILPERKHVSLPRLVLISD